MQVPNFVVENDPGATFRAGLNAIIAALVDDNAGSTEPPFTVPFMRWRNTSVTPSVLLIRNAANNAWITLSSDMGGTAVGEAVFRAVNTVTAQTALGASSLGRSLFTATSPVAARTALGGTSFGQSLFTATDAPAARGLLGGTSIGQSLFAFTSNAADGRSILGAPAMPAASGAGHFWPIDINDGTLAVLPAGGTWAYLALIFNASGFYSAHVVGIAAGGTTIAGAFGKKVGFGWRFTG